MTQLELQRAASAAQQADAAYDHAIHIHIGPTASRWSLSPMLAGRPEVVAARQHAEDAAEAYHRACTQWRAEHGSES